MMVPFASFRPMEEELGDKLRAAFEEVLASSSYVRGEQCRLFEAEFAEYCGRKHCIGVGNGLDAIYLSLKALGIGQGDEVIVPSDTFIATALAVTYTGAVPVFAEPDMRTYNISPEEIEKHITDRTRAVIPVHLYGQPADMDRIMPIAKNTGCMWWRTALRLTALCIRAERWEVSAMLPLSASIPEKILVPLGTAVLLSPTMRSLPTG